MRMKLNKQELERWATRLGPYGTQGTNFTFEYVQVHPRLIMDGASGLLDEYQRLTAAQVNG